jgi:hypothetical protein
MPARTNALDADQLDVVEPTRRAEEEALLIDLDELSLESPPVFHRYVEHSAHNRYRNALR